MAPPKSRAGYTEAIADIVLQEGLEVLALRGLAERLGTSARMLIYYFGSKETLVVDVVAMLALRLQGLMARFTEQERRTPSQFLDTALNLTRDPDIAPFMSVLTELVARGARGQKPYDRLAETLVTSWVTWIESRLIEPVPPGQAMAMLAIVEGMTILDAATQGRAQAAGAFLLDLLAAAQP